MKRPSPSSLFAALGLAVVFAAAPPATTAARNAGAVETVRRVETYLTGLRSIESDFVQSSSNGGFARGRLYVQRPSSLRLDYEPPSALQIYADGSWLIYVDTELEEVTHVPLARTPAAFLMGETVSFSGAARVIDVELDNETVRVELVRSDEPEAGSAILTFGRRPLVLRGWTVIDAQDVRTRIGLVQPSFNGPIDRSVFRFDPDQVIRPSHDQ